MVSREGVRCSGGAGWDVGMSDRPETQMYHIASPERITGQVLLAKLQRVTTPIAFPIFVHNANAAR